MCDFTRAELKEAQRTILSTVRKCEKAKESLSRKQAPGASQLAVVSRRLTAHYAAAALLAQALGEECPYGCLGEDLAVMVATIPSLSRQVEGMLEKFEEGTSQHTLAVRRIRAFRIALVLAQGVSRG